MIQTRTPLSLPFPASPSPLSSPPSRLLPLHHKLHRLLPRHHINTRTLIPIHNTITLIRHAEHLRAESGTDELAVQAVGLLTADVGEHLGDGGAVLGVEVGVDFVEEVEGGGIALLDGED